jgi:hypothetical protein
MDRFALEHNLRDACARVAACQEALLSQRVQVRELERSGLDASVARALLDIYEESKEMALFNRDFLARSLTLAQITSSISTAAVAVPPVDEAANDDLFVDDFDYREAA